MDHTVFVIYSASIWNSLPVAICQSTTVRQSQKQLNMFLFCSAYGTWLSAHSR